MSEIKILNMDVIDGLRSLPEKSVHCVITSPPYWGLRDYGVEGQIGLEKTPEEYLEKMVLIFREVWRVLRDDGTAWVNMGDCYSSAGREGHGSRIGFKQGTNRASSAGDDWNRPTDPELKEKDLVGMPWRLAFALQADGWYLRSDIIWAKPNPMPESVNDRPTKSHEYVFLLAKQARYFYDADAVREAHKEPERGQGEKERINYNTGGIIGRGRVGEYEDGIRLYNTAGRNRRTVWEIPTQPTPEAHFATFPEALVEPCIKAGTSERGCCEKCGAPWERIVEREAQYEKRQDRGQPNGIMPQVDSSGWKPAKIRETIWQPLCLCGNTSIKEPGIIPCTVLDPFGGSGTVAKVARDLNRNAILIEINPQYVEIAKRKLRANEQLFTDAVKVYGS